MENFTQPKMTIETFKLADGSYTQREYQASLNEKGEEILRAPIRGAVKVPNSEMDPFRLGNTLIN